MKNDIFIQLITKKFLLFPALAAFLAPGAPLAAEAPAGAGGLRIGWASADITPDRPVFVTGQRYARISEGVMDPITVTALALEANPGGGLVMVSCDLISIPDEIRGGDFRGRVRQLVREALPADQPVKVVLNATHTHAGPEVRDRTGCEERLREPQKTEWADRLDTIMRPAEYIYFATERIARVAVEAWEARAPGGISFGLGHAVVGHNRIMAYDDGTSRMYGPTNRAGFSHVEGWEDHSVNLLCTWNRAGDLTGVLVNIPSPSQHDEGSLLLSADFWHETREELRARLGEGLHVFAQSGAGGDQSERVMIHRRAESRMERLTGRGRRERIAGRIADAVTGILPYMKENIDWNPVLVQRKEKVTLPTREETPTGETGLPVEIHVLRLGEIAMATNPFELYLDFGIQIQERSAAVQTFIVQLAGSGSYLAPRRAAERGAYGSHGAYQAQGNIGPEGGRELVEQTVAIIERLFGFEAELGLEEVGGKRLPADGWRFRTDPGRTGREEHWFDPGLDDRGWRDDVPIENSWQNHLDQPYHGPAWYRRTLHAGDLPEWDRAILHFAGADEQAWVWLNGRFVGAHALGPSGWDQPFHFEVTGALKPGESNQLTVLVENTVGAGGIWRPVTLRLFR